MTLSLSRPFVKPQMDYARFVGAERFGRARAEQFPGPGTERLGHPDAERGAIAQSQLSTCSSAPVQLPG